MKPIEIIFRSILLPTAILLMLSLQAQDRIYYAVEIDGVLCGYATTDIGTTTYKGNEMQKIDDSVHLYLKVLGQDMNMHLASHYVVDPKSQKVVFNNSKYIYGEDKAISSTTEILADHALYQNNSTGTTDTFLITPEVIFDNPIISPYLIEDFGDGSIDTKTYKIFDYGRGSISDQDFKLQGEETLNLADKNFNTLVFNAYNHKYGTSTTMWVDRESAQTVQIDIMNRHIYRADESVVKSISSVDMDNLIFSRVNKNIHNFKDMTFLKVKADIQSVGEQICVEGLNFPGQKFEGTVEKNHVIGVFEIEPIRYDGSGAPPFPTDFSDNESLQKYLKPEQLIESDHPDIIAFAESITKGSADAWEAAVRLSKWVGKEISGAVPGGTSAIGTLNSRQGECGSHSRLLAAFNRAVGIPARLSVGCMYSTWYGGSFGQHAWTEVYMGKDVGWVAIDATILEYDYIDAGHIKLGEMTSFQPNSMEIIDYRVGDGAPADNTIPQHYSDIIGQYTNPKDRNVLDAQYIEGSISVDIMGRIMLALKEPDEQGRMYARLSDNVYFMFPKDSMVIVEKVYAMKKLDQDIEIPEGATEEYIPLLGSYIIFQLQKEFRVGWKDDHLVMFVPDVEEARELKMTGSGERWVDAVDKKEYAFSSDPDGSISGLNIFVTSILEKGATAAWIVEKAIEKNGIEGARDTFRELWDNRALDMEHTESDMNRLGYKYLGEDKIEEALLVFSLNTEAYPDSWNVYDSYGEALFKSGDKEKAIQNFERSLELNPDNENGRAMLEKINADK